MTVVSSSLCCLRSTTCRRPPDTCTSYDVVWIWISALSNHRVMVLVLEQGGEWNLKTRRVIKLTTTLPELCYYCQNCQEEGSLNTVVCILGTRARRRFPI